MTRIRRAAGRAVTPTGHWALQDAKARLSELVRKAKSEGPQRITIHGREEVVVLSADEYRRVKGRRNGRALVELLRDSPLRDVAMDRQPTRGRVRPVDL